MPEGQASTTCNIFIFSFSNPRMHSGTGAHFCSEGVRNLIATCVCIRSPKKPNLWIQRKWAHNSVTSAHGPGSFTISLSFARRHIRIWPSVGNNGAASACTHWVYTHRARALFIHADRQEAGVGDNRGMEACSMYSPTHGCIHSHHRIDRLARIRQITFNNRLSSVIIHTCLVNN